MSGITRATRELVLARDNFQCVSCRRSVHDPLGYSIHHRVPRGMGGTRLEWINQPANLLTLCGSGTTGCHGWTEQHRMEARSQGYLIPRAFGSPEQIPVYTADGYRRFDNDGHWSEAYPVNVSPVKQAELIADCERARLERMGATAA